MGFIGILIVIVSALLVLIVLVQSSKGGGLASGFSSSTQILGVAKTKDVLEQITWGAAGILFILCLLSTPKSTVGQQIPGADATGKGKTETTATPGQTSLTKTKATQFPQTPGMKKPDIVPPNTPKPGN